MPENWTTFSEMDALADHRSDAKPGRSGIVRAAGKRAQTQFLSAVAVPAFWPFRNGAVGPLVFPRERLPDEAGVESPVILGGGTAPSARNSYHFN